MKLTAKKLLDIALLFAFFMFVGTVHAEQIAPDNQPSVKKPQQVAAKYDLSELVPLATELKARLARLEGGIESMPDVAPIKKHFAEIESKIATQEKQLQRLQSSPRKNYARLFALRQDLRDKNDLFSTISKPLSMAISDLDKWDREWLDERVYWSEWQASMLKERSFDQLGHMFEAVNLSIDAARKIIRKHINILMAVQARGGEVKSKIDSLNAEIRSFIGQARKDYVFGQSLPIYSAQFYSQFNSELLNAGWEGLSLISWTDSRFVAQHNIVYSLLLVLLFVLSALLYRYRENLRELEHLHFVVQRPVATVLFVFALLTSLHLEFWEAPSSIQMMTTVIGGIACVRLLGSVLEQTWKRHAAYSAMIAFIIMLVLVTSGLPIPLFRLYTIIISLLAVWFCLKWAKESSSRSEPAHYALLVRVIAAVFVAILVAEFWGKAGVATYLLLASMQSMAIILPFILFIHMIRAGLKWVFFSSPLWQIKLLRNDAGEYAAKTSFIIETVIVLFIMLPAILSAWKVFDSVPEAINSLLAPGFMVGDQKITIGVIIVSMAILYGTFLMSHILPQVLLDEQVTGKKIERGVRLSIARLMKYFIILIGFLVTLSLMQFDMTKLTIMVSAFGIGIGFGLQSIVSNFVSGLIMLVERPLREGDTINFNNDWATIKTIGLRSTVVKTFDEAEVIIPNADLVNNPVINWTLSNREIRLHLPVGVAYGSDVPLVLDTLIKCAKAHNAVLSSPAPQVLFFNFGESSLDFEVRVWIQDVDAMLLVKSEIYCDIEQRFRELNITVPFPQRDLHLRSIDGAAQLPVTGVITPQTAE